MKKISLNLAARPLRNRRLFVLLGGGLSLIFFLAVLLTVIFFFQFTLKKRSVKASLGKLEATMADAQRDQRRLLARNKEAAKKSQKEVDLVNSIILKKSYPWTEFLGKLEDALPESSYILSLAPTAVKDTLVQFRFKVVSASLDDLLVLINRLLDMKFTQPRVESEERNDRGQLVSDISVSYERAI
jgi:Tfp pilus assembly protein PilN